MRKQVLSILKEIDAVHAEKYELVKKWESAVSERDQWRSAYEKTSKVLELLRDALSAALLTKGLCGCESGNHYEPEFVCGYHRALNKAEEATELPRPGSSE